jgi:membrane protein YdbS with pleckstrin-like domain
VILRAPAHALDPRMRRFWLAENGIAVLVVAVGIAIATTVTALAGAETAAWIVAVAGGGAVLVLAVLAVVAARLDYAHFRYEVTEHGLYVARGWLWRRWQVVPHARVQTVDTTSGPLLRLFGLVAVEVTTASSRGGTSIPGLTPPVADELVAELARRAGLEEGT